MHRAPWEESEHIIVSHGGGTNSTALLQGLRERGIRPAAIVMADTGGEKPHTYAFIKTLNEWLFDVGFPQIEIVKGELPQMVIDGSLEAECLRLGVMPSKAYGRGGCSMKWKVEPQDRYNKRFAAARGIALSDIVRLVGFDAGEESRVVRARNKAHLRPVREEFPLFEWGWEREECVEAIARAGLPQPGKSACFFCPSSKKWEILWLRDNHPDLLARALEIERRARCDEGEGAAQPARGGLGRALVWADFIAEVEEAEREHKAVNMSDAGVQEADCGCFDGD